jgi:hypothetical protein
MTKAPVRHFRKGIFASCLAGDLFSSYAQEVLLREQGQMVYGHSAMMTLDKENGYGQN